MVSTTLLAGFIMGLSLIIPIGAQNAFVLKLGLLKKHVVPVALLCGLMDTALIFLGVTLARLSLQSFPGALHAIKWGGIAFLVSYGFLAFKKAFEHAKDDAVSEQILQTQITLKTAVLTSIGFTLLNPHVYLDTVILLGSIGVQYQEYAYVFALGASIASFIWFLCLGWGAGFLSPLFKKNRTWMVLEILIGLIMCYTAYQIYRL